MSFVGYVIIGVAVCIFVAIIAKIIGYFMVSGVVKYFKNNEKEESNEQE